MLHVVHAYQNKYGHRMWHNVGTSASGLICHSKSDETDETVWSLPGAILSCQQCVLVKQKNTKSQTQKSAGGGRSRGKNSKKHKGLQAPIDKLLNSLATRRRRRLALRVAYALHPAPTGNYTT